VEAVKQNFVKRAFDGPMWHGPALAELVAGVSSEEAAAHPVPGAHSIWELVLPSRVAITPSPRCCTVSSSTARITAGRSPS